MFVHPRSLRGALVAAVSSSFALVLLLPALAAAQAWQPSVTWNTYLGGGTLPDGGVDTNTSDQIESVALALDGDVVVTGWTNTRTFPTDTGTPAGATSKKDVFVARYSADGQTLRWARVFGGAEDDIGTRVVMAPDGAAYVVGTTRSSVVQVPLSVRYSFQGRVDGFLARLNPDGTVDWFMYLGSTLDDEARDIVLGPPASNVIYVVGRTGRDDGIGSRSDATPIPFPPNNAQSNVRLRAFEVFVSQVNVGAPGDPVVRWTRILKSDENDNAYSVTAQGDAVFVGGIMGSTFDGDPTTFVRNSFGSGANDGFVARLEGDAGISWFRYVGGSGDDDVRGVLARPDGGVSVVGNTNSSSAPVSGSGTDVFVLKLSAEGFPIGSGLRVSEDSSGNERTEGQAAMDPYGNVYVGGRTTSLSGFALNAFDSVFTSNINNTSDGFIAMVDSAVEQVIFKSYVGGLATSDEWVQGIAAGREGRLTFGGYSNAPNWLIVDSGVDLTSNAGTDGFLFNVVVDSTRPTAGTVTAQITPQGLLTASWGGFNDPETPLTYEWGIDVFPGTDAVRHYEYVGREQSATLALFQPDHEGPFYVTVRATNAAGLTVTASSGSFLATPKPDAGSDAGTDAGTTDGGATSDGGTSDGGTGTDAGVADGGTDGGEGDGDTRSPLGWSCASGGSSGTLALTALGVMGVLLAMRRERPAVARERARGSRR
jgi:hypothetical protein